MEFEVDLKQVSKLIPDCELKVNIGLQTSSWQRKVEFGSRGNVDFYTSSLNVAIQASRLWKVEFEVEADL